jgi:hypothetical protein
MSHIGKIVMQSLASRQSVEHSNDEADHGGCHSLRSAPLFDPVSILRAAKSGLDPSAYTLLLPDPAYIKRERFGNRLGSIGAII